MEGDRKPDAEEFQEEHQGQAAEKFDLRGVVERSADGLRVRVEDVLEQKCAHGDDATQRMQTPQQKFMPFAGAERRYSVIVFGWRMDRGRHYSLFSLEFRSLVGNLRLFSVRGKLVKKVGLIFF